MADKQHRLLRETPSLRKLQILRIVQSDPTISQNEISRQLSYAVSAVNRTVRELQTDGELIRNPEGWHVTDKGRRLADELSAAYSSQLRALGHAPFTAGTSGREPVGIGLVRSLGTAVPLVAKELGMFDAAGIRIEERLYDYAAQILQEMHDGRLAFGYGGMAACLEERSEGTDAEFLAACNSGGHALVVKRSLGITSIADLRQKTILVPPEGTVAHRLLSTFVRSRAPDVFETLCLDSSVSPANMLYALQLNSQYAGMVIWEPWVSLAETNSQDLVVLIDFAKSWQDAVGKSYSTSVLCTLAKTVTDEPDLVRKILRIHRSTIEFLNQEPEEANRVLADVLNMPLDVIQAGRRRVSFHSDLQW